MIKVILSAFNLSHLKPRLREIFKAVGWCIRDISEDNVERILVLRDGNIQNCAVLLCDTLQTQIEFSNTINSEVAGVLVFLKRDTDFEWLFGICPVEYTCLLREYLELPKLFALGLHDIQSMKGAIDH